MLLLTGLGNIGPQYEHTRHNIGFMALDRLAASAPPGVEEWQHEDRRQALTQKVQLEGQDVLFAKPITMMNDSGQAVSKLAQYYRIAPQDIWVIYDELDLPLGRLKIGQDGSDNGHNGIISVHQHLGHNRFWRIRVGVDTREAREIPGLEYVLQNFPDSEQELLDHSLTQTANAIRTMLATGPQAGMQQYNKATA